MFTHIAARLAAFGLQDARTVFAGVRPRAFFLPVLLALAGCATAPSQELAARSSDPAASVPADAYRSVTRGFSSQRPADPLPWSEQNQRVAPSSKGDAP